MDFKLKRIRIRKNATVIPFNCCQQRGVIIVETLNFTVHYIATDDVDIICSSVYLVLFHFLLTNQ